MLFPCINLESKCGRHPTALSAEQGKTVSDTLKISIFYLMEILLESRHLLEVSIYFI